MGKLTVRAIESAKPKDKPYKLMDGDGLQLRVAVDGDKTWLVRYIIDGKERQYRLPAAYGSSGTPGSCSLVQARDEAARIRALARQGTDIQVELERQAKAEHDSKQSLLVQSKTVADLFDTWTADGVRRKDGNAALRRMFNADILPRIGTIPISDLTEHHIRDTLRAMVDRGVNRTAVIARNSLTQMFAWGRKRQPWRKLLVDGDPMDLIEIDKIVAPGYDLDNYSTRILMDAEIVELHAKLVQAQADYDTAPNKRVVAQPLERTTQLAIWIMLSTLCRVGETSMARWEHVNLERGEWFIPRANVKDNVADLTVFLSDFAIAQFEALRNVTGDTTFCFPGRDPQTHIDLKSISKQIGDRQFQFKKAKDGSAAKPLQKRRADNSLVLAGGTTGAWTPHDLRRTGATLMQRLGVSLDIIDRCQNHVLPGSKVRRHYLHHDYADETRAAWALLGDHLQRILQPTKT